MDPLEKIYRERPNNELASQHYIEMLIDSQRILEAKYYHDKLIKINPSGLITNKLGYLISVWLRDPYISEHELQLKKAGINQEQNYALQLYYYYVFSNLRKMRECAHGLLDYEPTEEFTYKIIIETVIRLQDYELADKVIRYILPRLKISEQLNRSLRNIVLRKLLNLLSNR